MFTRRSFLFTGSAIVALGAAGVLTRQMPETIAAEGSFEVEKTAAEWREQLTDIEFSVLREEGTERAFTSPLNDEHREGTFICKGCDLPLFDSATKYDSHTGWPSFYQPLDNAVGESTDNLLGYARTEIHCRRCGGHLGHVFNDGPEPTGLRYCMNGVSLKFDPAATA